MQDQTELLATLERSTRTGVHVIGLRVATYAIGFAGSILIARAVGPEGRGRYVLPLAVLAIVFTIGNLGLEHAQIYLAGRKVPLTALWANATFIGIVAALVVWALAALVLLSPAGAAADSPISWLLVALVQLPLMLHILYWLNILQLAGRVRAGVAASAVAAAVQTVAVVALFVTHGLTPFRVLVLTAITTGITWLVVLAIGWRSGLVSLRVDRAQPARGAALRPQGAARHRVRVPPAARGSGDGPADPGVQGARAVLARGHARGAALAPVRPVRRGAPALPGARRRATTTCVSVTRRRVCRCCWSPAAAVLAWVASPWLIRLAFGAGFDGAIWPFRLLLPGIVALAIQRPLAGVLLKRGRPGLVSCFGAGALALNVALNLLLLARMGVVAASIGSSLTYVVLAAAYVIATRRSSDADARRSRPSSRGPAGCSGVPSAPPRCGGRHERPRRSAPACSAATPRGRRRARGALRGGVGAIESDWGVELSPAVRDGERSPSQWPTLVRCPDCGLERFEPVAPGGAGVLRGADDLHPIREGPLGLRRDPPADRVRRRRGRFRVRRGTVPVIARVAAPGGRRASITTPDAIERFRATRRRGICLFVRGVRRARRARVRRRDLVPHPRAPRRSGRDGASRRAMPPSGGRLLLSVPNRERTWRDEGEPMDRPPHHVTRWGPEQLTRLAERTGLAVQEVRFEPPGLRQAWSRAKGSPERRPSSAPGTPAGPGRTAHRPTARAATRCSRSCGAPDHRFAASTTPDAHSTRRAARFTASPASRRVACRDVYSTAFFAESSWRSWRARPSGAAPSHFLQEDRRAEVVRVGGAQAAEDHRDGIDRTDARVDRAQHGRIVERAVERIARRAQELPGLIEVQTRLRARHLDPLGSGRHATASLAGRSGSPSSRIVRQSRAPLPPAASRAAGRVPITACTRCPYLAAVRSPRSSATSASSAKWAGAATSATSRSPSGPSSPRAALPNRYASRTQGARSANRPASHGIRICERGALRAEERPDSSGERVLVVEPVGARVR